MTLNRSVTRKIERFTQNYFKNLVLCIQWESCCQDSIFFKSNSKGIPSYNAFSQNGPKNRANKRCKIVIVPLKNSQISTQSITLDTVMWVTWNPVPFFFSINSIGKSNSNGVASNDSKWMAFRQKVTQFTRRCSVYLLAIDTDDIKWNLWDAGVAPVNRHISSLQYRFDDLCCERVVRSPFNDWLDLSFGRQKAWSAKMNVYWIF